MIEGQSLCQSVVRQSVVCLSVGCHSLVWQSVVCHGVVGVKSPLC